MSNHTHTSNDYFVYLLAAAILATIIIIIVLGSDESYAQENIITVYKSPTCGCCSKWVTHLEDNGFKVNAIDKDNMTAIKNELGVPVHARSCHTAVVNDYVIEGHVPAADIKQLLTEKRPVAGLAVPGMPMGSPGMEGHRVDAYQVYEFDPQGQSKVVKQY